MGIIYLLNQREESEKTQTTAESDTVRSTMTGTTGGREGMIALLLLQVKMILSHSNIASNNDTDWT